MANIAALLIPYEYLDKAKLTDQEYTVSSADLINNAYLLVQKGKKNYTIIEPV